MDKSYKTFRHPDVAPIEKLKDDLFVLELFHGPTFAFKDVALQLLGNLFEFFLLRRNAKKGAGEVRERLTVVGATSGDTGRCVFRAVLTRGRSVIMHHFHIIEFGLQYPMRSVASEGKILLATFPIIRQLRIDQSFPCTGRVGDCAPDEHW